MVVFFLVLLLHLIGIIIDDNLVMLIWFQVYVLKDINTNFRFKFSLNLYFRWNVVVFNSLLIQIWSLGWKWVSFIHQSQFQIGTSILLFL